MTDFYEIARFVLALVFVLSLMGLLAFAMRRVNGIKFQAGQKRRLGIIESLPLDARRRLVLLRRDDVEHLVILGTNGDTVIECGLKSGQDKGAEVAP